jgi:two-component system, chemotaxis family, CheB/CheR fusion protein
MAEILSRHTSMPVQQIEDGMGVEPNQVFVTRPGHTLSIEGGHFGWANPSKSAAIGDRWTTSFVHSRSNKQVRRLPSFCLGWRRTGRRARKPSKRQAVYASAQDPESAEFSSEGN